MEKDIVVGWQGLSDFGSTQITKAGMSSTYVSPSCHSRGVGKRLLAHATTEARSCGFDYIVAFIRTDNTACINIVASLGWVMVGPLPRNLADGTDLAYYSYAVPLEAWQMTSGFINVTFNKRGAIAFLTINRPKTLNTLSRDTVAEILSALEDVRNDGAVRGLIVTGAGARAFAAGADINEIASLSTVEAAAFARDGQEALDLIENLGKPVIAAVNGFALGGGCEIAMACTLRIAAEHATFGQPEVKLGVIPGFGGTQRLPRLIGCLQCAHLPRTRMKEPPHS
jgi:hypothetical protein